MRNSIVCATKSGNSKQNTKFETASTSKHDFGNIYEENGKHYLKLNMQVRFIK